MDNLLDILYTHVPVTVCYIKHHRSQSDTNLFAIIPYSFFCGNYLIEEDGYSYNPLCFVWCPTDKNGFISPRRFFDNYYANTESYYFFAPLKEKIYPRQQISLEQIKRSIKDGNVNDNDMILIKFNKKTKKMFISSQNFIADLNGNQIKIDDVMKHVIYNDKIHYHNFEYFPYLIIKDSISHLKDYTI